MELMSSLFSMEITLGLKLFRIDLNIFLTTFESGIGSPRLNKELTISRNSE